MSEFPQIYGFRDTLPVRRDDHGPEPSPVEATVPLLHAIENLPERLAAALTETGDDLKSSTLPADVIGTLIPHLLKAFNNLERLAEHFAPAPDDIVDSNYVARKTKTTTKWISEQALKGDIPSHCIVPGTGRGKRWKFYRKHIDTWIANR